MNYYWPLVDDTALRVALAICAVVSVGLFLLAVSLFMDEFDEKRRQRADG